MPRPWLRKLAVAVLAVNLALAGYGIGHHHTQSLKVTFLDVGQGDAAVIETPGGRVVLIDTGGTSATSGNIDQNQGRLVVEPYLRHEGVSHIDAILLSHPHADHIGGADTLINDIPTDLIVDNGEPTEPPLEQKILADAAAKHTAYRQANRGQTIDLGEGVRAEILAPTEAERDRDRPNNCSIVVRLVYGKTTFLFMGDAEKAEEEELLSLGSRLKCDVLKVGHHGSNTSSIADFVAAAHPSIAVISVGAHNRYGHPGDEVIQRLKGSGARVDRTDQEGAVTCTSDGETVTVQTMH